MLEVIAMITLALMLAWGASALDATPHKKEFTYPGSKIIQEAQRDYHG